MMIGCWPEVSNCWMRCESESTTCRASLGSIIRLISVGRLADAQGDLLFKLRIERDRLEPATLRLVGFDDLGAERAPGVFGEFVRIFCGVGVVADFFQDAGEIANGNALGEQVLQDALHLADVELRGNQFGHHGRMRFL